jgi:hypothetical protein
MTLIKKNRNTQRRNKIWMEYGPYKIQRRICAHATLSTKNPTCTVFGLAHLILMSLMMTPVKCRFQLTSCSYISVSIHMTSEMKPTSVSFIHR